jgi:hypothetical protein
MTESRIDELLDQHVPAFEPRSDGWEDVLARAHTTRRRYAALAVAALALLLVPTAVALRGQIADLFQGTPAPPAVSTSFEANNKVADMATQKGFGARFPHADVTNAHRVSAPRDRSVLFWLRSSRRRSVLKLLPARDRLRHRRNTNAQRRGPRTKAQTREL